MIPLGVLGAARVASGWTPASISDLWGWWKADAITGVSNGATLAAWADSSALAHNASSADGPTYWKSTSGMNINSALPVVDFNNNTMTIGTALTGGEWTAFGLVRTTTAAFTRFLGGNVAFGTNGTGNGTGKQGSTLRAVVNLADGSTSVGTSGFFLSTHRYSDTGNSFSYRLNGAASGSGTTTSSPLTTFATAIGCRDGANDNDWWAGSIAEIVLYSRSLSDAECATVETALTTKWSLT